ncbi:MAG: fibronectin type III domain-containing protein [Ferruginibacter sp.]
MRKFFVCIAGLLYAMMAYPQAGFNFSFANSGQRVCLADTRVDLSIPSVTIRLLDASLNSTQSTNIYRRPLYGSGSDWVQIANNLPAGTASFSDNNVAAGERWEYKIRRTNGSNFATGYSAASLGYDASAYRGQMVLLLADNIANSLPGAVDTLKRDLTGDGWQVNTIIVKRAAGWDSGDTVVAVRQQVQALYNATPAGDKPRLLFIVGHVPLPRSGLNGQTPDDHSQNAGARGADTYYADIDGVFTDEGTYNPGNLSSPYAENIPGDYKWDQDNIPSELEMGFGRIDFADISSYSQPELVLMRQYLDRLHQYKHKASGYDMGKRTAFYFGYDNSNDGSYRSLPSISRAENVIQNTSALLHPQWVQQNGPFLMYMQNVQAPQTGEWDTYGMNAAIYSSDQSYWGFGDVPEGNQYSKIRSILGANSKCVMAIWTTMAINIFHQAGLAEPVGLVCRQIMDHNLVNQKLEKPSSPYDTPAFWNRTHFELYGDPSVRLHQVAPASNLQLSAAGANAVQLQWQASSDQDIVGYHVYHSATEFGKYERINPSIITSTGFTVNNAVPDEWLMVRAVKQDTTGAGIVLNPSQGIFIKNTVTVLPVHIYSFEAVKKNKQALLRWKASVSGESLFSIERSSNTIDWANIGTLHSRNSNNDYSWTDEKPLSGNNFYRIKATDVSGSWLAIPACWILLWEKYLSYNLTRCRKILLCMHSRPVLPLR